jgi:hypothetical protein
LSAVGHSVREFQGPWRAQESDATPHHVCHRIRNFGWRSRS